MVWAEHVEIADSLIDAYLGQKLKEFGKFGLLQELRISDLGANQSTFPLHMRVVIDIPPRYNDQAAAHFESILGTVLYLVDRVAKVQMNQTIANKCEKVRKKLRALNASQTTNEEQELERKRQQRQIENAKLSKMTPEEQKKYEQKQKDKDSNRRKKKLMKVVK